MQTGIYQIKNLINNKSYIGSAKHLGNRKCTHWADLKYNRHANEHLQRSFNKYGIDNFEFQTLLYCDPKNLLLYEQACINKLKPEYNKRKIVNSNLGIKFSEEHNKKISEIHKGNKYCLGHKLSEEHKRKISIGNKGKVRTQETRERISKSKMGNKNGLGQKWSEETRRKTLEFMRTIQPNAKTYKGLISPEGEIYKDIFNLNRFCREHNLNPENTNKVICGKRRSHKGWVAL